MRRNCEARLIDFRRGLGRRLSQRANFFGHNREPLTLFAGMRCFDRRVQREHICLERESLDGRRCLTDCGCRSLELVQLALCFRQQEARISVILRRRLGARIGQFHFAAQLCHQSTQSREIGRRNGHLNDLPHHLPRGFKRNRWYRRTRLTQQQNRQHA